MALAKQAQIVLMPYNYILDPSVRSAMSLALEGAVVILDEAHNVEGVCRDAGSLEVSLLDMVAMASDLCDCSQLTACSLGANLLLKFVMKLLYFTSKESRTLEAFENETDFEEPPPGARKKKQQEVINTAVPALLKKHWACDSAGSMFWAAFVGPEEDASTSHASLLRIPALNNLERFLFVTGLGLHHPHDYGVNVMSWDNVEKHKLPVHTRTSTRHASCPLGNSPFSRSSYVPAKMCRLNIWLMSPSVVFDEVPAQTHSVILTSGTLSPLHSLRAELGRSFGERLLPFPQQALEANHVINPERQLRVIPVGHSPRNKTLMCKKVCTDNDEFVEEIGRTVVALAKHIPAGVLVFLSSYKLLQRAVAIWRKCEVWADLERIKGVIVEEPEAAADFKAAKRRYEDAVDGGPGGRGRGRGSAGGSAILLAVYRGKMSEGISFNDHYARGVLCVGIPYPNLGDPKIVAKKCYNDWKSLGRKPEAKDRGEAGRRSWPDVCAAGDHNYGSAAANQGRSSSSSSGGGVVGGGTAVCSAAGSGGAGAGAVGERSAAGDVGDREGAVVGERGGGGGGGRPARIVASGPPKVSEDGEAAVSLAAPGEEPAVKAEMAAVKAETAETAAEAAAAEAAEAEAAAAAAEMAASRAAAKATAKAAHEAGKALLSGSNWYAQEAYRAQNQALGRCIRHVYDYGVVCLIDERIRAGEWKHVKFLAKWMRDLRGDYPSFEHVVGTMDQFFASAPGFVREEKERAAVLRHQASVRRRRAKEMAAAVAAQGAPGGSGGDGGGGLLSAEAESSPVGMEVEAVPLANWGGGSENGGGSGSDGTLSGSCSKTAAGGGGGGGVRRPLSVVDEGVRNHRQRNEPSAVVTPPPPLTVRHATPTADLSSSVSSQPASDNAARDRSGEAGFSSSEGTNGALVERGAVLNKSGSSLTVANVL
ncbi:conserved unknown protein [Ectocarpus siliculosus]|uniref:Helicase ATP-binding domain-containing protein n=1 Tax=Ectocarpus siliculosus TaxID=2880 RepID=D8LEJ0_ECTSI|nr:conserved unknown protein [Ectocarpus siliculosus]|eukprot:CBN80233.1 conserved unknown protein [Ectocarpus siliculosus]